MGWRQSGQVVRVRLGVQEVQMGPAGAIERQIDARTRLTLARHARDSKWHATYLDETVTPHAQQPVIIDLKEWEPAPQPDFSARAHGKQLARKATACPDNLLDYIRSKLRPTKQDSDDTYVRDALEGFLSARQP